MRVNTSDWWGPPKKFSAKSEERKISWLELFYDLVYVIAISKMTHHLATHLNVSGFLDYTYFFAMIFWGWLNGSQYHDLHGTTGLTTILMTLWQMLIVAGLVVTIGSSSQNLVFNANIAVMALQLFITYLWWSVGIYDKEHRQLNKPYTFFFLASFALMFLTLFLEQPYLRIVFFITLILNFIPPFIIYRILKGRNVDFSLSASMTERLGLFTIIIFGEVVLGVINGVSALNQISVQIGINFVLAILIVFALWWLFFTLVSDRPCKKGFQKSSLMQIFYIPTLMALGIISVAFTGLFENDLHPENNQTDLIKIGFGTAICVFLLGVNILLYFLEYTPKFEAFKKRIQRILSVTIVGFAILTLAKIHFSLLCYLGTILGVLLIAIIALNQSWYAKQNKTKSIE
ncbi:MAG: low temperature requirement protein A [Flavobacterium sp.]